MRKLSAVLFAMFLMSAVGMAQVPTSGNVFFGYSFNHGDTGDSDTNTLNGWEGSVEGKIFPHLGLVADVAAQYGTQFIFPLGENGSVRTEEYLFGPRLSFRVGKFRPYVHALIGAGHLHEAATGFGTHGEFAYADAIGGGVDYRIFRPVSWRVQLDALQTNFHDNWQSNARFSTGLVVHF